MAATSVVRQQIRKLVHKSMVVLIVNLVLHQKFKLRTNLGSRIDQMRMSDKSYKVARLKSREIQLILITL